MKSGVAISCAVALAVCGFVHKAQAAEASAVAAPATNRSVSVGIPVKVTSDTAQFFYDQGALEFQGHVHLHKIDFKFEGGVNSADARKPAEEVAFKTDVKAERTDLDLYADRVTIFLDQAQLDKIVNRQPGAKKSAGRATDASAAVAKRREQIEMLTSLVADGGVSVTNRTVSCKPTAEEGTSMARAAAAGGTPAFPAGAEEKAIQTGDSAKVVYFGDTSKVVLYGDEKAPARLCDSDSKTELEGGKITCWLDISVDEREIEGKKSARKVVMGVKLKQAVVEKSVVTLQSGSGNGLDGVKKNK